MQDQVITTIMAYGLQGDADREGLQFGWIVLRDQPDHPDQFIARFATEKPTVYVLAADSLNELRQLIPAGLERSERQPAGINCLSSFRLSAART